MTLPVLLRAQIETWPYVAPFRNANLSRSESVLLVVTLESDGKIGRGEAAGVRHHGETAQTILTQSESVRGEVERGISRQDLQTLLPPGGARNALDCALWDLEAKIRNVPAWSIAKLDPPRPLLTTFTCSAESPREMAEAACAHKGARAIKLKLTGDPVDAERVAEVRRARPDVWLCVDANQGFTPATFTKLLPVLIEARVELVEQPFPAGQESWHDSLTSPIPVAADESAQDASDIPKLVGRFEFVNIKLDKCGGLTEGLAMARAALDAGLKVMVGNAFGTSLAMAPAFLIGQLCSVVDLDGPTILKADRNVRVTYSNGFIDCPKALWGYPDQA